jgi:hypothetical protein
MKRMLIAGVLLALVAPVAAIARPSGTQGVDATATQPTAAQLCKQQRRTIGMASFRLLYAPTGTPRAAYQNCLAKQAQLISTEAKNAAKACEMERSQMGATAFKAMYGTGKSGKGGNQKNAFGKCVSLKARQLTLEQQQTTLRAAKTCKAERNSMGASAFGAKYGTNAGKSNAFGKCVRQASKAQQGK